MYPKKKEEKETRKDFHAELSVLLRQSTEKKKTEKAEAVEKIWIIRWPFRTSCNRKICMHGNYNELKWNKRQVFFFYN